MVISSKKLTQTRRCSHPQTLHCYLLHQLLWANLQFHDVAADIMRRRLTGKQTQDLASCRIIIIWLFGQRCSGCFGADRKGWNMEWEQREKKRREGWLVNESGLLFSTIKEISFDSCIGEFRRELMKHGNLPSKGTCAAHALITSDCDVECCCHLETPALRRDDTRHEWETVGSSLSIWNRTVWQRLTAGSKREIIDVIIIIINCIKPVTTLYKTLLWS